MSVPGFNDPFNPYYDQFSIKTNTLVVPNHFDHYVPDNQNDYQCSMVITPSIQKGAIKWTLNGKFITIGIYKDEGRSTSQRPPISGLNWTRSGLFITIIDPAGHKLNVGDSVNVTNVNIPISTNMIVTSVIDAITFTFSGTILGATSGSNASYQDNFLTNFYETRIVFRLLPSFALVPFNTIQQIFSASAPTTQAASRSIDNITTGLSVKIPNGTSASTNYELPTKVVPKNELLPLNRRFDQVYDEQGSPLKISYSNNGAALLPNNMDSSTKNEQIFNNTNGNSFIIVYDYYGIPINDNTRSPTFSTTNVIRNEAIVANINNLYIHQDNLGNPIYNSTLYDLFGNLVIGVQNNNALIVRKQILPLTLDLFNRPIKRPL